VRGFFDAVQKVVERVLDHPVHASEEGSLTGERLFRPLDDFRQQAARNCPVDVGLVAEDEVERGARKLRRPGDVVHGRARKTIGREDLQRAIENARALRSIAIVTEFRQSAAPYARTKPRYGVLTN